MILGRELSAIMLGFSDMTLYSHGRRPGPGRQYYRLIGRSAIKPEDSEPDQPDSTPTQDCYREQMGKFLDALRDGHVLADGAMGSYLFELTGRLSEQNHVYEAFNIDRPEIKPYISDTAGTRLLTVGRDKCAALRVADVQGDTPAEGEIRCTRFKIDFNPLEPVGERSESLCNGRHAGAGARKCGFSPLGCCCRI